MRADLNSAISEAEISMVKCEIQSVFDKCNLIWGVIKIFVSGSNAWDKDSKNFLVSEGEERSREILILALQFINIYVICPSGYFKITFWAIPNSTCNSHKF